MDILHIHNGHMYIQPFFSQFRPFEFNVLVISGALGPLHCVELARCATLTCKQTNNTFAQISSYNCIPPSRTIPFKRQFKTHTYSISYIPLIQLSSTRRNCSSSPPQPAASSSPTAYISAASPASDSVPAACSSLDTASHPACPHSAVTWSLQPH